jgi:hypothetical protein
VSNQFQLKSIFYFAGKNGTGSIVTAGDSEFREELEWQNIENGFALSKIKEMICFR